jgi:hypothetical protein
MDVVWVVMENYSRLRAGAGRTLGRGDKEVIS